MSLRPLITILCIVFIITGCQQHHDYNEGYNKGYENGQIDAPNNILEEAKKKGYQLYQDAKEKGYQQGYEEGFKKVYPGTPTIKNELYASIYYFLVLGGVLKIVVALLLVNIQVIFNDGRWQKKLGKILFSCLGIGAAIFMIAIVPETSMVLDILFMRMLENTWLQIIIASFSAVAGYFFVKFLIKFVQKNHTPVMLGWCSLVLSAILTFLIPFSFLYATAPDIPSYSSSLIFCGMLIGVLYFFGYSLLRGMFDDDAASPESDLLPAPQQQKLNKIANHQNTSE